MKFDLKIVVLLILVMACFHASAQAPYTLEEVLQIAKANNPTLKSEQFEIAIAETDILSAEIRPNLVLSNETIQMTDASEFASGTSWSNPQNREVLWQLGKQFQIMGQRQNKIAFATKSARLSAQEFQAFESNILLDVAQKWNEVWTAQQHLEIIQLAKNNIDSLVIINEHRYRNQIVTKTDVLRTELLAKQYDLQYIAQHQELLNQKKELQLVMGITDSIAIDMSQNFDSHELKTLAKLQEETLRSKKEVQVAKSLIEVSESNHKLQRSMAYPQPEIGVIYNSQNKIPHFGIAASIELPFFDRNQGEIKKSLIVKDQAEQQLQTLMQNLETEIDIVFSNYQTQLKTIKNYSELLDQSKTILDNVKYSYLKGGTNIIDFLEAQRNWLETQEDYNQAQESFRRSYIQLLYATGLINP